MTTEPTEAKPAHALIDEIDLEAVHHAARLIAPISPRVSMKLTLLADRMQEALNDA